MLKKDPDGYAPCTNDSFWISPESAAEMVMAIQPSDLGEEFVRSGKRLITQRSADELLVRARVMTEIPHIEETGNTIER